MADFKRSAKDVAHAARRFRTIDGINSDDNQIAVRPLGEHSGPKAGFPVKVPSQYGSPSISTARKNCGKQAEASRASTETS
jgi:hypothetical protein